MWERWFWRKFVCGWIGPDHPNTATPEWGQEMVQTTADYIVDLVEELKKVKL